MSTNLIGDKISQMGNGKTSTTGRWSEQVAAREEALTACFNEVNFGINGQGDEYLKDIAVRVLLSLGVDPPPTVKGEPTPQEQLLNRLVFMPKQCLQILWQEGVEIPKFIYGNMNRKINQGELIDMYRGSFQSPQFLFMLMMYTLIEVNVIKPDERDISLPYEIYHNILEMIPEKVSPDRPPLQPLAMYCIEKSKSPNHPNWLPIAEALEEHITYQPGLL